MGQLYSVLTRCIALCVIFLSLSLMGFAKQGKIKVTLEVTNKRRADVLHLLEKQTGMIFFYASNLFNTEQKISVSAVDQTLDDVLEKVFEGTGMGWNYEREKFISIKPKKTVLVDEASVSDSSITSISISGRVVSTDGSPLPGATVIIKGTTNGVNTDQNGNFNLSGVRKNQILTVRNLGYETRELSVTKGPILVKLNVSIQSLDETVIKGYYNTTKKFNTGNVSSVKAEDISKQPVSNPLAALQGRVPGMQIIQQTGVPGGTFTVQIRGRNSINSGNNPLYIVDGVPYVSEYISAQGAFIIGTGSPLNFINPASIESIDILKDADATAIYGSRGANGVILITTKRGSLGGMKIDVNVYKGIGKVATRLSLLNREQYLMMKHESFNNDGRTPGSSAYPLNGKWDTTRSTDWQKEMIGGTAQYTDVQTSLSGGSDQVRYLIGSGYHKETTVFPSNFSDEKVSINVNLNARSLNKKLSIDVTANYIAYNNRLPNYDLTQYSFLPPVAPPLYTEDGALNWQNSTWSNPLSYTKQTYSGRTGNLIGNFLLSYRLFDNLTAKASIGYNNLQMDTRTAVPSTAYNPVFNIPRNATFSNNNSRSWIIEPQINYSKAIGLHSFELLIGSTLQKRWNQGVAVFASGYESDELLGSVAGASTVTASPNENTAYKYAAIFSRLQYTFGQKYLANLTARRDASSRFGPDRQAHSFSSVGLGWIFSSEPFLSNVVPALSFGKVRASYGTSGNDQIKDYGYLDLYQVVENVNPYQQTQGFQPAGLYNPEYSWEVNRKFEAGLELGFLKDKIFISISHFRHRSSNQLIGYTLPQFVGFGNVTANRDAVVSNTGWEGIVTAKILSTKAVKWSSSFNISATRNKLVDYPNLETSTAANFLVIGQPLNAVKLYSFAGVDPATGVYQFLDHEGKLTFSPNFNEDRIVVKDFNPKFYGGLQNSITYGNISLDFLFQFVKQLGNDAMLSGLDAPGRLNTYNPSTRVLARWQKPGDNTKIQKFTQLSSSEASMAYQNMVISDYNTSDASFIRLKNVSLSFELPVTIKNSMHLTNCRIYAQGQNLLTFTKYDGFDPENQSIGSLPPLRVITLGIQVGL